MIPGKEQHKVNIELVCPFVEKLVNKIKKSMWQWVEKCSKELSCDTLRK